YGIGSLFFDLEIDINKIGRLKISKCDDESAFKEMFRKKHEEKLIKVNFPRNFLEIALLDDAAGFCTIIKAISKSNKVLIGHNIYLDLLHTLKAFCCDLPSNYEEFKKLVNRWFPKLVDTKVLVSQPLL
uniref:Poly(A)-specific ribonuclease n=1 Tax=Romanomermis culicivorax TaxID=13658 RepID=A0A915L9Q6_ROMCU